MAFAGIYLYFTNKIKIGQSELIAFFVYYTAASFAVTAGYHRFYSHCSYKCSALVNWFFLAFGAAAFVNSAIKWARDHRNHHAHTDQNRDPYNINKGFFYAHLGWALLSDEVNSFPAQTKDLESNKLIMYQDRYIIILSILMGILVPWATGYLILDNHLFGLFFLSFFRIFFFHHSLFLINSYCHTFGSRPLGSISASNSLFVAILTMGDGYHHFHHIYPSDYRAGRKWFNIDLNKWILFGMNSMGLIHGLKKQND